MIRETFSLRTTTKTGTESNFSKPTLEDGKRSDAISLEGEQHSLQFISLKAFGE
jgi:hypothetical protein